MIAVYGLLWAYQGFSVGPDMDSRPKVAFIFLARVF